MYNLNFQITVKSTLEGWSPKIPEHLFKCTHGLFNKRILDMIILSIFMSIVCQDSLKPSLDHMELSNITNLDKIDESVVYYRCEDGYLMPPTKVNNQNLTKRLIFYIIFRLIQIIPTKLTLLVAKPHGTTNIQDVL